MVWGLPPCVWARETKAPAQGTDTPPVPAWGPSQASEAGGSPHGEAWDHSLQCCPGAPTLTQAPPSPDSGVPSWAFVAAYSSYCLCWVTLPFHICCMMGGHPCPSTGQAGTSLGFSRQEHWSGLPFPSPMRESEVAQSCPTLIDPMECSLPGSSVHGIFQAEVVNESKYLQII